MKTIYFKSLMFLISAFLLGIFGNRCLAEQMGQSDVDNAIKLYENGNYDMADKLIVAALKKDKRDVAALTWYSLIKMEIAKNKRELNPEECKAVVNKQISYLNTYFGVDLLFLDDDKLNSYYHAAYAKAYWLNYNEREVNWFLEKSLALYPNNYEALHVKGQVAFQRESFDTAYKSFVAEMEAAGNEAPEIRSRAAYWAALALQKQDKKGTGDKTKALLESSIKSNPDGAYGALSKKMLGKSFPSK